jgi:CRISPR-associated protein Csm4
VDTYAVYLRPRGALYGDVHSGTLFGGICWAIRTLGLADLPALLEGFNADPLFVLSSPFPCLWGERSKPLHFYPRPRLAELTSAGVRDLADGMAPTHKGGFKGALWDVIEWAKQIKNTSYVSETLFQGMVTGKTDTRSLWQRWKRKDARSSDVEPVDDMLLTTSERESLGVAGSTTSFSKDTDVQRNQIDRIAGATAEGLLFFERQTFLRRGTAGMWFLLRTRDLDLMQATFRYLADTGIGGRRTTGKGQFDIRVGPAPSLPETRAPNAFVSLSLYLPADGDWDCNGEPLSYQLINLRGKHESRFPTELTEGEKTQRVYKEMVRSFVPGSIFPLGQRRQWYGQISKVGQIGERTVWQNGLTLPVFARIGGG